MPQARGGYVEKIAVRMETAYLPREVFLTFFALTLVIG
jgi:hypothetical protein